jgi:hypothetical protein
MKLSRSHETVEIKVFLIFFCLLMEGFESRIQEARKLAARTDPEHCFFYMQFIIPSVQVNLAT